mgnify:CR=1 FL=1
MSAGNAGSSGGSGGSTNAAAISAMTSNQTSLKTKTKTKTTPPSINTNARENYRSTQYSSQPKTNTFKTSKTSSNDAIGKSKLSNYQVKKVPAIIPGSIILNSFTKLRQKAFEDNRKLFREKVLTGKNRSGYKDTIGSYSKYMTSRLSGSTDAYGNTIKNPEKNRYNNPTVIKKNIGGNTIQTTAPTEAEVSQSEAANADAAALKVKKRGRSQSIMTGSKGVTKTAANYSLGKPSLLGQV